MMCHLYFSRYKLFNYKYVHIVKPNILHLNKDFFFIYVILFCVGLIYLTLFGVVLIYMTLFGLGLIYMTLFCVGLIMA